MPATLIYTREGWIDDPAAVFDAVAGALVEGIGASDDARRFRLEEVKASHVAAPKGSGERYTEVHVALVAGRSLEKKQAFVAALRRNFGALGVPEKDLKIVLLEGPPENFA